MGRRHYLMLVVALLIIVYTEYANALTGHVCSSTQVRKRYTNVHSGFLGWGRTTVARYYSGTTFRCCDGWRTAYGDNCSIPICITPCYNGGTCVAPNTCACSPSHQGANCATSLSVTKTSHATVATATQSKNSDSVSTDIDSAGPITTESSSHAIGSSTKLSSTSDGQPRQDVIVGK